VGLVGALGVGKGAQRFSSMTGGSDSAALSAVRSRWSRYARFRPRTALSRADPMRAVEIPSRVTADKKSHGVSETATDAEILARCSACVTRRLAHPATRRCSARTGFQPYSTWRL